MKKQAIRTDKAPIPIGPFNQAIRVGNLVFTSGHAARNRETGKMGDIAIRPGAASAISRTSSMRPAARSPTW
jgi:enamine deaminase RidA (YjgF/YER057c/UK114 family)